MRTRSTFDYIALTLVIIGAINWGLIGLFQFDIVATLFGGMGAGISRIIYALVGLAGLYSLSLYAKMDYIDTMRDESEINSYDDM